MNKTTDPKGRRPDMVARTVIDPDAFSPEQTSVDPIRLTTGTKIEQYELIRELGRGGMGQVFLARDNRLGRRVAMKFLVSSGSKFTQRFLVEARATAQCSHEHIVVIHDVDEYLGLPYMVLEYVEGMTLGKLMTERRLPLGRAIELIVPVVKALARAHGANIVHRDLKPDNIIVTASGTVKVLDFGIAKLFTQRGDDTPPPRRPGTQAGDLHNTRAGAIVGTLPYMSPEQLGTDDVDHRSDLWAVGIILFEMLAGKHPLDPVSQGVLFGAAAAVDEPMPSLADVVGGVPDKLVQIVARCLAKRKVERYATADELLADLEPLLPGRAGRNLVADESPYPGLNAFQESDANRFFGRAQDVAGMVTKIREQPLVGVVGPSGVGKSSFVRAGVVPALKSSGEPWETLIVRPGRHPLSALASTLESLRDSRDSDPALSDDLPTRLRAEPGVFGARLRARSRKRRTQILLFIDQHEELYTLVVDPEERKAFTACLAAAADDPSGPLRVVVSMRSDFLDRAAEDRRFVEELTRGLVFLQPPSRAGLEAALTQPLEMKGYGFEPGIVNDMLATLEATPGSLPLLQFTAAKLWDTRDKQRRMLTRESYYAMGGIAGALATHADEVLAGLAVPDQKIVRAILQRLVTPERTRAIVDQSELRDVSPDVERIISHLVGARLLVVQTRGEGEAAVEIVHESLIKSWPTLRRWLDENHEDGAFLAQLRAASKQWDQKGRPQGLLWRGEAMEEARLWKSRYLGELPPREQAFIDEVIALGTRAARIRRRAVIGAFAFLLILIAAGGTALLSISNAKAEAERQKETALNAEKSAREAADKEEAARKLAEEKTDQLSASNQELQEQLARNMKLQTAVTVEKTKAGKAGEEAARKAELAAAADRRRAEAERERRAEAKARAAADARAKDLAEKAKAKGKISTGGLK